MLITNICLQQGLNWGGQLAALGEILPFLIPLVIAEFALLGYTLYHILTHEHYKRGSRALWIVVTIVGMQFIGPILYFLLGREN